MQFSLFSYVIVVEHDLSVLDYLSDFICCLYGKPGAYGVVTLPFSVREGINIFLSGFVPTENLRFREDSLTFKVCILSPTSHLRNIEPIWVMKMKSSTLRLIQWCMFKHAKNRIEERSPKISGCWIYWALFSYSNKPMTIISFSVAFICYIELYCKSIYFVRFFICLYKSKFFCNFQFF